MVLACGNNLEEEGEGAKIDCGISDYILYAHTLNEMCCPEERQKGSLLLVVCCLLFISH